MEMFCYQCEQTAGGKGCTKMGVCGKDAQVAALQDLLTYQLKGIGFYGQKLLQKGIDPGEQAHNYVRDSLFSTLTNVNFDAGRFKEIILVGNKVKDDLLVKLDGICGSVPDAAQYRAPASLEEMLSDAQGVGLLSDDRLGEDIKSLKHLLLISLKGLAAYAHHAYILGYTDQDVDNFHYKALAALLDDSLGVNELIDLNMELGKVNFRCMEILDEANTGTYGNPEPTYVPVTRKKGPFIIVSGHDLKDLKALLEQTEGKGINIYTNGEMLPAHAYPELKIHQHLVGNFGGAWYEQQKEFDGIPGCILMTTNCLQKPKESYKDRIFTTSIVGWPDVAHIEEVRGQKDFTPIIEKALELGGWDRDEEEKKILVGFGRSAVLSHADLIIDAVKKGQIRHFFLVGGCDGAKPGRNYYTEFAEKAPLDTVILTLACGKYRFNKKDLGSIGDLPRLLDIGQCNDAYSAIKIALALADAFECGVNDLPLTLIISWYEQKACAILLTLLSLGVKNIRLGPSLPAFVSPNVLQVLVDNFNIAAITTVDDDLQTILG